MEEIKNILMQMQDNMNDRFDKLEKRMGSHEIMTVQLIGMVADVKKEVGGLKQDIEFICKDNAMTRLEVDRTRRIQSE